MGNTSITTPSVTTITGGNGTVGLSMSGTTGQTGVRNNGFRITFSLGANTVCDLGCNDRSVVGSNGNPGLSTCHTPASGSTNVKCRGT